MTTTFLAPDPINSTQFIPGSNTPANGGQLFFYVNLSSTKQTVYKDPAAATAWSNPIVLDSGGNLPSGGEVWFTQGQTYTVVFAPANDTDPPGSPYWTKDNLSGINDVSSGFSEWIAGPTPTFVSTTSFTLVGDQTSTFQPGRRVLTTNTSGAVYGTILTSVFGALTTVTILPDSGVLDSGLSAVSYGLLSATNPAFPVQLTDDLFAIIDETNRTKKLTFQVSSVAASTNIQLTSPSSSGTIALVSQLGLTSTGAYLPLPLYHMAGFAVNNSASSTAMDIGAGQCRDSSNTVNITTAGFSNKTLDAWAAGSSTGAKLSAAAISTNTWYAWYALGGSSGAADVGFDTAFPPAVPTTTAAFPYYRYIGGRKTSSTAIWIPMIQRGDDVFYQLPPNEFSVGNPSIAGSTQTFDTVPRGVRVAAQCNVGLNVQGGNYLEILFYASQIDQSNQIPSATTAGGNFSYVHNASSATVSTGAVGSINPIWVNTSAQMRWRVNTSIANLQLRMWTTGWYDPRGKDGINI